MIRIDPRVLDELKEANDAGRLRDLLQQALCLELTTIPPYLAAVYSLRPGFNSRIRGAIRSVAMEEMLHMAVVANVLNAVGGRPRIDQADLVPTYPTTLPMSIGPGLVVGVEKFSKQLVENVFMRIEQPENPLHFPDVQSALLAAEDFATIGTFYHAVMETITRLGAPIFTGDPERQVSVVSGFGTHELFAVTDPDSAIQALAIVVEDGEGTTSGPLDHENELAHYYRFAEIVHGKKLRPDTTVPQRYSYSGAEVPFDHVGVADFPDNPKAANYAEGSPEREKVDAFNRLYSQLLHDLQLTFDGQPEHLQAAINTMTALEEGAKQLVATSDGNGRFLGPPFEFVSQ